MLKCILLVPNLRPNFFLQQGILDPVFSDDLVYKFKRIVVNPYLSDQFKKINVIRDYNLENRVSRLAKQKSNQINFSIYILVKVYFRDL